MRLLRKPASRGIVAMALAYPLLFGGCDASKAELQATKSNLAAVTTERDGLKTQLAMAKTDLESVKKERDDALSKLAAAAADAAAKSATAAANPEPAAAQAAQAAPTAAALSAAKGKKPPTGAKNSGLSTALSEKGAAVQHCAVEHALEKGAKKVVVSVRVTINSKGEVVDSRVSANVTDGDGSKVKSCVEAAVRSAKFPAIPTPMATDERSWTIAAE